MAAKKVRARLSPAEIRDKQGKALEKAKERVRKLEESLEKARQKLAQIEAETPHKLRLAELAVEVAAEREALKTIRSTAASQPVEHSPKPEPAATVTTQDKQVHSLSQAATDTIRKVIGRKRKGILSPLDGEEAQSLLKVLDEAGNCGDVFVVRVKGRNPLRFEVCDDGLSFKTVEGR